jgi:hypothetical protein
VSDGKDHVDHIESAEGFLGGDLGRIDSGCRFLNIDDFADFLLVGEGDFDVGVGNNLELGLERSVEAFLFDAELVFTGRESG